MLTHLNLSDDDEMHLEGKSEEGAGGVVPVPANEAVLLGDGVPSSAAWAKSTVLSLDFSATHPMRRLATLLESQTMATHSSAEEEGAAVIVMTRAILHSKGIKHGKARRLSDTEDELELDHAKVHAFLKNNANGVSLVLREVSSAITQMDLVHLTADQLLDLATSFLTMIKTYGSKGKALDSPDFRDMPPTFQQTVGEFWFGSEKLQKLLADKEDTFYDSSSGEDIASPASNGPSTIDGSTKRQADGGEQSPPSKAQRVSFSPNSDDGASVNTESAVVDRFSAASRRQAEDRRTAERMGEENPLPPIDEFEAFHDSVSGEESSDGEDELAFEGGYFAPW